MLYSIPTETMTAWILNATAIILPLTIINTIPKITPLIKKLKTKKEKTTKTTDFIPTTIEISKIDITLKSKKQTLTIPKNNYTTITKAIEQSKNMTTNKITEQPYGENKT